MSFKYRGKMYPNEDAARSQARKDYNNSSDFSSSEYDERSRDFGYGRMSGRRFQIEESNFLSGRSDRPWSK